MSEQNYLFKIFFFLYFFHRNFVTGTNCKGIQLGPVFKLYLQHLLSGTNEKNIHVDYPLIHEYFVPGQVNQNLLLVLSKKKDKQELFFSRLYIWYVEDNIFFSSAKSHLSEVPMNVWTILIWSKYYAWRLKSEKFQIRHVCDNNFFNGFLHCFFMKRFQSYL